MTSISENLSFLRQIICRWKIKKFLILCGFELGINFDGEVWVYDGEIYVYFNCAFSGLEGQQFDGDKITTKDLIRAMCDYYELSGMDAIKQLEN